jgi:hypothetical protein
MSDRDFVAAVEACTVAAADFRHADHVRLAWLYLNDHPLLEAIARYTAALRRLAAFHGAPGKYHETITWAYLVLIHERMRRDDAPHEWEGFRAANGDLFCWKPSILERYYAPQTLKTELARRIFVLPDQGIRGATTDQGAT